MALASAPLAGDRPFMRHSNPRATRTLFRALGATLAILLGAPALGAQSAVLTLPDLSQHARVVQRIGLTDLTVDYHRPRVAGRTIFGGLQAYGDVWRAGANLNTTFETTDPISVEGHALPKGIYGVHMIPGRTSWVVIFSKNSTSWGSFYYDSTEDALRVTVTPAPIAPQDVLSYSFDDPAPSSVVLTMRWEKVAVPIRIDVDATHLVAQSLRDQLRGRAGSEWNAYEEVANYLLENSLDAKEALVDADQSIAMEDRFENEMTRARALTALGRTSEATAARSRALTFGTQAQVYAFGRSLQRVGVQGAAMDVYRVDAAKHPGTWISHTELARLAVASNDYARATQDATLAVAVAPPRMKAALDDLIRQLRAGVNVNR